MKKLFFISVFILGIVANAQFKISGEIEDFNYQTLLVRIYQGANYKVINKVTTDGKGKFTVNIPEEYNGIVNISDRSKHAYIDILTANEDVSFKAKYETQLFLNPEFLKGKTAIAFGEYQSYENYIDMKNNIFPILKALYSSEDDFFKAITKEEKRISNINPASNVPLLSYYSEIKDLAATQFDSKAAADIHKLEILKHLVNDNENLEGTGYLSQLVLDYFRTSIVGSTDQKQINSIIASEVDVILEDTALDTPRGQNVLSAIFTVLPKEQFGDLLEGYYEKANALTCEITEELQSNLSAHNMKTPGSLVPNIVFNEPVKGYKSLYDIKADKKIIMFWGSWCPACMSEMPFVKEYYDNFKKEGGEIVGISLDYDDAAFKEATKDLNWINYTELLQWDTQGVESFGVSSTPTLFLVDKDNKLIKQATHISDLVEL